MANPIWMAGERIETEEVTGRMPCIHKFDQPTAVDMRVDLGGGRIIKKKKHLQRAQIRAAFEEVRRKCVTPHTRRDALCRQGRVPH